MSNPIYMSALLVPVAAYLVLVPQLAVAASDLGGHDLARAGQLMLGLVCALLLVVMSAPTRASQWSRQAILGKAALAVLAIASTVNSSVPAMAARELALFAGLAGVAASADRQADVRDLPCTLVAVASSLYVALVLLVHTLSFMGGQGIDRAEMFIGYDNYRFYNHVQSVALPLSVLAVTVLPKASLASRLAWFAAGGGFALLLAVAGRATLLGIALAAVLVGVLHGRAAGRLLGNLMRALVLGLTLFAGFFLLLPWLTGVTPVFSDTYYGSRLGSVEARLYLWQLALAQIGQSPWLGVGPMHYAHHPNPEAAHPHNVYLQMAAEWGLPALLLTLVLAAMVMRRFHQRIVGCTDASSRDVGIGLQMACFAAAIDGLFSGNFVMPVSQVWIAFTAGWAWAWCRGQSAPLAADKAHRGVWRQVPAWLLLASQVWLYWSVWPELVALPEYLRQAREQVPNLLSNPRFWSHGWF